MALVKGKRWNFQAVRVEGIETRIEIRKDVILFTRDLYLVSNYAHDGPFYRKEIYGVMAGRKSTIETEEKADTICQYLILGK